jgi:dienelactone hydrolase
MRHSLRGSLSAQWTPRTGKVFDFAAINAPPLLSRTLKRTESNGIVTEEVKFLSEMDGRKPVEIFAYFSYPKGRRNLPAFIWIEGGLAPARTLRTHFGARRGYATMAIDFPRPGLRSTGLYPINLGLELGENPRQAPIYHGAVALLRAVSFLESRPEVDKNRIGMAGSSWGGLFTTLMTGVDRRLKVGACMFGTGNLQLGNMWWDAYNRSGDFPPILREHWRTTLDGAFRLRTRKTPIAWFTGTNDWFFWMPSVMKTFGTTGGAKHLSLLPNWDHALTSAVTEQTFQWLDIHLKGAKPFLEVSPLTLERRGDRWLARWSFSGTRRAREARLLLSYGEAGNWHTRYWKTLKAQMNGNQCTAWLPTATLPVQVSGTIVDDSDFRYSTPLRQAAPLPLRISYDPDFTYDSCHAWGNYEPRQWDYLKRHHVYPAALSREARDGKFSAVLPGGERRLPQLQFTEGVPHRLSFSIKVPRPIIGTSAGTVPVVLETATRFNNTAHPQQKPLLATGAWTDVTLDITPRESLLDRWNVRLQIPEGATILIDRVRFEPISSFAAPPTPSSPRAYSAHAYSSAQGFQLQPLPRKQSPAQARVLPLGRNLWRLES